MLNVRAIYKTQYRISLYCILYNIFSLVLGPGNSRISLVTRHRPPRSGWTRFPVWARRPTLTSARTNHGVTTTADTVRTLVSAVLTVRGACTTFYLLNHDSLKKYFCACGRVCVFACLTYL